MQTLRTIKKEGNEEIQYEEMQKIGYITNR